MSSDRLNRAVESLARALGWWLPLPGSKTTPAAKPGEPLGMWRRSDGRYVFRFLAVSPAPRVGLAEFTVAAPVAALACLLADLEVEVPCPECVARGGRWEWRQGTGLGPGHAGSMRVGGWTFASAPWLTDAAWGDLGWLAVRPCPRCSPDLTVRSLEVTVEATAGGLRELKTTDISKPGRVPLTGTRLVCEAAPRLGRHLLEIHDVGHGEWPGEWQLFDRGKPIHRPLGVTGDETVTDLLHRLCVALPNASIERDGALVFNAWQPTVEAPHPLNATLTCIVSGDGDPQARERLAVLADRLMEAGEPSGEALALWLSGAGCPACEGTGETAPAVELYPALLANEARLQAEYLREQGHHIEVRNTRRGYMLRRLHPCEPCHGTAIGHRFDALAERCERRWWNDVARARARHVEREERGVRPSLAERVESARLSGDPFVCIEPGELPEGLERFSWAPPPADPDWAARPAHPSDPMDPPPRSAPVRWMRESGRRFRAVVLDADAEILADANRA